MMLRQYSLKALEVAINTMLALDESTELKIAALEGKVIELNVSPFDLKFFICFENQRLCLQNICTYEADTIIHSSLSNLIRLKLLKASKVRSLFNDKVKLAGDIELGMEVKKLFDTLDIDWEAQIAVLTGDVIAAQLGSLFQQGQAFKKQLKQSMQHNFRDYLQEELQVLPTREEINDFFCDVDTLSLQVERLHALLQLTKFWRDPYYEIN